MPRRFGTFLSVAALFAVALLLRISNFHDVFGGGAIVLAEEDTYYHLRRVLQILADYPRVPLFDPAMNYPFGAPVPWPPLFDLLVATCCRLAGLGPLDVPRVETLSAFVSPVLGAATVVPVFLMTRALYDQRTALLAAALLAFLPAHQWYSRLGFVDHHSAVTLLSVTTLGLFLGALLALGRQESGASLPRLAFWAAGGALALAAGLFIWNGFLLHVFVLDAFLIAEMVVQQGRHRERVALLAWTAHLAAAAMVLPVAVATVRTSGEAWTLITLSYFHVTALVAFGLVAGAVHAATAALRRGLRSGVRASLAALVAGGFLALVALQRQGLKQAAAWFFTTDPFMREVNESKPFFVFSPETRTLSAPFDWITLCFVVLPVAWAWCALRHRRSPGGRLLLVWTAALFAATLGQRRFMEALGPVQSILVAGAVAAACRALGASKLAASLPAGVRRAGVASVAAVFLGVAYLPSYADVLGGGSLLDSPPEDHLFHETLCGFRATVLEPGQSPPGAEAREGAMCPWAIGHKVLYLTGLPVVSNNFGTHIGLDSWRDWSRFFMATTEDEVMDLLERRRIRWVLVDDNLDNSAAAMRALGLPVGDYIVKRVEPNGEASIRVTFPYLQTMFFRLARLMGAEADIEGARGGEPSHVSALGRFRLVYDTREDWRGYLKIYERVPGARLEVETEPRIRVSAAYTFVTNAGKRREYRTTAEADARGVATMLVPYPSDRASLGFTSRYRVSSASRSAEAFVAEEDIRSNRSVRVSLRSEAATRPATQ